MTYRTLLAALLSALLVPATGAQETNPQSLYGRDSSQGVYVRDSATAIEKFALAERMERLKEWNKSADVYQEILEKFSDRVVPSQLDKDNRIYQYTSVGAAVQERLSKWPDEGLNVYRARYDNDASTLLQSRPDDPATLHKVVSLYFVTDAAKQAALRLIDIYLENGDFAAAAWMGDRLLALHPNLMVERPMVLYRVALAYHLSGNQPVADERVATLKKDFATATGQVRGQDVVLAESIDKELAAAHPAAAGATGSAPDAWPMAFGSPDRARIPDVAGGPAGAKIFSIDIVRQPARSLPNGLDKKAIEMTNQRDRSLGMMTGVLPVVDRGELFFQDNARVYAVSLDSGLPLAGWAQTYDGDRNGRYTASAWTTPRNIPYTLALTDDAVYAIMGQPDTFMLSNGFGWNQRDSRLVCLDRRTGKEKWVVRPKQLPTEALRQLDFTGSPLVVGDNVYVTAHGGSGMQFEDSYVLCFDRGAGRLNWSSYIASSNPRNAAAMWDADLSPAAANVAHLAYASGRLYALTNLGALAAIDAYDGTIVWLNIYPRDTAANDPNLMLNRFRGGRWQRGDDTQRTARPWSSNPVIVAEGKVFVLPSDSKDALIYDAGSGVENKRIHLAEFGDANLLLAATADRLLISNASQLFCVNWPQYDAAKERNDNLLWASLKFTSPRRTGTTRDTEAIRGRPFVTSEAVYFPTEWAMYRISMKNGSTLDQYPPQNRAGWDDGEEAGNVLVTQDHLILAGPSRVNVYTDLKLAMAKLDSAVNAAPNDPEPRLRYAEVMFVAGKPDLALAKLDEAIAVAGNAGGNPGLNGEIASGAGRDRIFNTAMMFAQKLVRQTKPDNAMVNTLFDRAAAAAGSPQQQVNYRLARARFARSNADDNTELTMLQEVLSDPRWRAIPVTEPDAGGSSQASSVAEKQLGDLIKRSPLVYEPVEARAAAALEAARTTGDAAKLLEVAQTFPNAKTAAQAMLAAAQGFEAAGNNKMAAQVLRQLYLKYPDSPNKQQIVESLARNYLAIPNHVDVAIARLAQAVKGDTGGAKLTVPMKLPDGRVLNPDTPLADALKQLRQYKADIAARSLPDLKLPPYQKPRGGAPVSPFLPDQEIAGVSAIVPPSKEFVRYDRIVTFRPGAGVAVYAVGAQTPLFTSNVFPENPAGCAWVNSGEALLVWGGPRVALLKGDSGEAIWNVELKNIPVIDVATRDSVASADDNANDNANGGDNDNDVDQLRLEQQLRLNNRVVIVQGQRLIIRPNGVIQQIGQQQAGPVVPAGAEQVWQLRVVADRAIVGTTTGRVLALDLADGRTSWQIRAGDRPVERLLASDDFAVATVNDNGTLKLIGLDAVSGQTIYRRDFAGDGSGLINLALSPDGKLVYAMPDQLVIKDLFEPDLPRQGNASARSAQQRRDNNPPFGGAIQADQMVITEGKVLIASDNGQFVRVYSLESGKPVTAGVGRGDADTGLQTMAAPNWQVSLLTVGPRLYVWSPHAIVGYHLDHSGMDWSLDTNRAMPQWTTREAFATKDHIVLLDEPIPAARRAVRNPSPPVLQVRAFSRAVLPSGIESGVVDCQYDLSNAAGIPAVQPVDGGMYYVSADQKLHFLKSGRQ